MELRLQETLSSKHQLAEQLQSTRRELQAAQQSKDATAAQLATTSSDLKSSQAEQQASASSLQIIKVGYLPCFCMLADLTGSLH